MKVGVWNGGLGPHQPFHSGSSCQPGGPNFPAPMISAPIPGSCSRRKALSRPSLPPGSPTNWRHHRVTNIHSCCRSPAWPNGASRLRPSPVPKPSSETAKNWTRASDMARAPFLIGGQLSTSSGTARRPLGYRPATPESADIATARTTGRGRRRSTVESVGEEDRIPVVRALVELAVFGGAVGGGLTDPVDRASRGGRGSRGRRCLLPGPPLRPAARVALPASGCDRRPDEADRDRDRRYRHALREPAVHGRGRRRRRP